MSGKYKAVASGAITNGKPVLVNSTGTVTQISGSAQALGTAVVFESAEANWINTTFDSSNNKVVISYQDNGNSNYGTAIVATIDSSDNSVTYGSPVVFNSATTSQGKITFDSSNNKVVIAYNNGGDSGHGYAIVGTVSGTSISFGSAAEFENAVISDPVIVFDSSNNKVVIAFRDEGNSNYGTAIVGTVSSTSISFGSATVYESANSSEQAGTFDNNSNKVVIAYKDGGNSNNGTAIVGTVSGTSISFGSAATFDTSTSTDGITATFDSSNNKVFLAYQDGGNSNYGTAVIGTVSGTSISFGSEVVYNSGNSVSKDATFDTNNNKVVLVFLDHGNSRGQVILGTVSGTGVSFSSATTYDEDQVLYSQAVFDSSTNKLLIAYHDDGNSSYGTARVFAPAIPTNLTSENYIGIASGGTYADTAEATIDIVGTVNKDQSGLTAGQTYFVQNDGTLETSADSPSVVAGTAISATELIVKG